MSSRTWHKLMLGSAMLAMVAMTAAGCTKAEEQKPPVQTNAPQKPSVKVSVAELRTIDDPQEVVAEIAASDQRDVVAKASGDVKRVYKQRGDQVKKGELLFELDTTDVLLQKQKAEISLRTAQLNLKNGLFNNPDDPDALQPLKDQIQLAQIGIQEANRTLENYRVEAPISGILTDFSVKTGMTVSPGNVGVIQQINPVKIKANITEDSAELVKGKKELSFYSASQPDVLQKAKIVYFSDIMDTQQRTYAMELQTDNAKHAWKPGAKVQLRITEEAEQEVLTIPTTAIVREETGTFVYINAAGKAEKRQVELGRLNGMYQEVTKGIKQGEQIIVSGQHQLKDKQEIEIVKAK
ncbi:efflux RND transporter periplasmic adaptor subunit [Paenibacillus sp. A14]|uniref:efflux RND transporter periplasmic adaptor subunit n=1 Tax=Paenibacillus sp. A14 TaxID=3119820 RepID=UPI002FDF40B6